MATFASPNPPKSILLKKGNLKYTGRDEQRFFVTLRKRVDQYFKDNNISRQANAKMKWKTVLLFAMYLGPFGLMFTGWFSPIAMLGLSIIMGAGLAGVGMSIMHDGNHGAYSRNQRVNKLIGSSIYLIGGNMNNWKIQHNVLHHTFTNVIDHDEDIDNGGVVRLSVYSDLKKIHRFQHIYAFFLYGLMTLSWLFVKDFGQMRRYEREGLKLSNDHNQSSEYIKLILTKILYFLIFIVLPLVFMDVTWWQFAIGFFVMHFVAGLTLAVVFQLAHVVEGAEQPIPNESGDLENTWAIHQLYTTANFARNNRLLSWFVGGLNFQIEHHLFPQICHIHYREISDIVKQTAQEFKLPYFENKSFFGALASHYRMLKQLGRQRVLSPVKA